MKFGLIVVGFIFHFFETMAKFPHTNKKKFSLSKNTHFYSRLINQQQRIV